MFPYFLSRWPVHLLTSEGPNLKVVPLSLCVVLFDIFMLLYLFIVHLFPTPILHIRGKFMEKGPCLLVTTITLQTVTGPGAQQIYVKVMNYS